MQGFFYCLILSAVVVCSASIASADSLYLRDGQTIQGTFLGGTARQVRIEVNGQVRTYDVSLVQTISFSDADSPSPRVSMAPPARPAPPPPPPPPPAAAPSFAGGETIPADILITVRMVDSVNSETSRLGQTFLASLDEPIVVDGRPVIGRGADVMTKLVDDQNAGKLQGRTVQTLVLVSIKSNGRWVDLSSDDVRTESGSQGAKSAKIVGGTAVLGAILGGIAGGGKGAAIGTVSGAAVGTGAAVLTSGEKVVIPSETRLTFRLKTRLSSLNQMGMSSAKQTLAIAILAVASAAAANMDVVEGSPGGAVKVIIYSDLECDYCLTLRTMLDEKLLPRYGKQVAFIHRDLPLPRHKWARSAAMAGRWIHEQNPGLGVIFRRELLAEQSHITQESLKPWLVQFADRHQLSEKGITDALTDQRLGAIVDDQIQTAMVRGIKTVPTVIVAGKTFSDVIVYDDVARVIDQALPH